MAENALTVFLSGTRRDVPEFWPAAGAAIAAALPALRVNMMEDSEPEDIPADHWSRREATKPDVLVGLVGRYYGKVLRGQERSLTEQEFDVAGLVGIERLMFTTENCASGVLEEEELRAQERVQRFRVKIDDCVVRRGVTTAQEFAEHVVLAIQQWERRTLRGVLQPAKVYFAPLLDAGSLHNHTEALIGQSEILAELEAFCSSSERIFVLHAPWGRGKSRLLLELARRVDHIRFLRDDVPLTRQHLDVSAVDPVILVMDDLQRRDEIQLLQLLAFLQRCGPAVKLVVASRSNRVSFFQGLIRSQGLPASSVLTRELPALADSLQHDLISHVLGRQDELTHQLAVRTRGSSLAAVLAARMIRRGQATFAELDQNPDFVAEVLGRFQDVLLLAADLDARMRERLGAVLRLVAICGPVRPGASEQRNAMAEFLGCKPEEISRDVELLEDRGLLLRRGGLVTIPVDAVRETEALRACVTSRGDLTGFAERALRELTGPFRGNLLRNLALVDFQSERAGLKVSLLDEVWPEIEAAYDAIPGTQRLALLRDLEDVAPYQPVETLRFVRHVLATGLGPPEADEVQRDYGALPLRYLNDAMARAIRGTLYHPECVPEACDLLWSLARDDSRPAPQHTDCAERVLVDMAKLDPSRPLECYHSLLGWAETKATEAAIPGERLVNYLEPLLEKELQRGYADDRGMRFWAEGVLLDRVRPLQDRTMALLGRLAQSEELRTAVAATRAIGHALLPPAGAFGRRISPAELSSWEPVQLDALERLRALAASRADPLVDLSVLQTVDGVARFSEQEKLKGLALDLRRELMQRLDGSVELALVPHWDSPWDYSEESQKARPTAVASSATHAMSVHAEPDVLIGVVRRTYDRLRAAQVRCEAATLLFELTRRDANVGVCFIETILRDDSEIAEEAGGAFASLFDREPPLYVELLDRAVSQGRAHVHRAVARGYFHAHWRSVAGQERFLLHVGTLVGSPDAVTRIEAIRAIWLAKEVPVGPRAAILLDYDPTQDPPRIDMWAIAVADIYGELESEQRRTLLGQLERLPSLGYFDDRILERLCADEPRATSDMLLARVQRAGDEGYDALPSGHGGGRDPLVAMPESERERTLQALGTSLTHGDFRVQHAAEELFALLGGGDPAVRRRVRLAWADSGDPRLVLSAARSFRREVSNVLFEEEDVVVRVLKAARAIGGETDRRARSELLAASSVEVRHGSAREPDYLDAQIRDQARAVAARYPAGSPEHAFYTDLAGHAQSMIDLLIQHEQELDFER